MTVYCLNTVHLTPLVNLLNSVMFLLFCSIRLWSVAPAARMASAVSGEGSTTQDLQGADSMGNLLVLL